MEFDEGVVYNWETEEVERKTINIPTIKQREEETDQDHYLSKYNKYKSRTQHQNQPQDELDR